MTLVDKLVNKFKYRIDQLVTDPEAEAAVARAKRAEHLTAMKTVSKDLSGSGLPGSGSGSGSGTDISGALTEEEISDGKYIMHIFVKTMTIIITTFLALVGGSMAANSAIHRSPIIRILYFIYGIAAGLVGLFFVVNPFTMIPSLLLFAGLKYYDYLPHWYAFLPISQIPATSSLGQIFKKPFYWDLANPDNKTAYMEKLRLFKENLKRGLRAK
jgi:hypothetical protein